jgi:uncharacterized membrane protein
MTNIQYYKGAIDPSGCVSNAWNLIKPNYGMYLGIAVLAFVLVSCIPCLNILLMGPITAGVYYVLLRDMRGEPVDFGMMFKGFEKFGQTLAVGAVIAVPGIIWQIFDFFANVSSTLLQATGTTGGGGDFYQSGSDVAIAGGFLAAYLIFVAIYMVFAIVWSISFVFAIPLVIEHNIGPIEALKLSAKAAWSNVGGIIVLSILIWAIMVVGVLALCIGWIFALPIVTSSFAFAYRQVFPAIHAPTTYTAPPPPSEYGNSFGREG